MDSSMANLVDKLAKLIVGDRIQAREKKDDEQHGTACRWLGCWTPRTTPKFAKESETVATAQQSPSLVTLVVVLCCKHTAAPMRRLCVRPAFRHGAARAGMQVV